MFEQEVAKIGKQAAYMTTGEKMLLVKGLKESGVFQIRGGVDQVAHLLGITRYTVYNYLKNIETQQRLGGL
jgi:predicted transcriptional regulator YheO